MPIGIHPAGLINHGVLLKELSKTVDVKLKVPKVFCVWGSRERTIFNSRNDRVEAAEFSKKSPVCDFYEPMPTDKFYKTMASYRFMLSPFGNTYDTYKTFEALATKTIPIILKAPYAEAYQGLPVVVVDSWDEVTAENLEKWWKELSPKMKNCDKYTSSEFWWQKIQREVDKINGWPSTLGRHLGRFKSSFFSLFQQP